MKKAISRLDPLLVLCGCLILGILLIGWWDFLPFPWNKPPETNWIVRVDGLARGEVFLYGPSHDWMRERVGGSDEKRKLVLLDGTPPDLYADFMGGDLYQMAADFSEATYLEIDALPENSYTILQYNIYYMDGSFTTINIYPHAVSIDGKLYTVRGDTEGELTFAETMEFRFWILSEEE